MKNFGKHMTKTNCTSCNREIEFSLEQVAQGSTLTCICGQKIRLQDKDNSAKKAINDINKALSDLEKSFKKLGR